MQYTFSFSKKHQSCVCTTATLSHRFKSSPAIPGKVEIPDAAGYMMNVGHFRQNYVSSGDLNRPRESRGSQPFGVLLVLFVQAKRIKPFPCWEFRGSANLESAHPNNDHAQTNLKPSQREIRGFANLDSAHPKLQLHTNPIKSFCRFAAYFRLTAVLCGCAAFLVACGNRLPPTAAKNTACRPLGRHAVRLILHPARRHTLLRRYAP